MVTTALLTLSLLAGSGCSAFPFQNGASGERGVAAEELSANIDPERYSLQEPMEGLDCKYEFELPIQEGADPGELTAARVYADAAFTQEVPSEVIREDGEDGPCLKVLPATVEAEDETIGAADSFVDMFHRETVDDYNYANAGRWYGYGGYYLVRYVGEDGGELEKPEVTYFTVEDDVDSQENRMAEPLNVSMSVTENGSLFVTWDPVEGADHYEVWLQAVNENTNDTLERYQYKLLDRTQETSYDSWDYDQAANEEFHDSRNTGEGEDMFVGMDLRQNRQFEDLVIGDSEDVIFFNRKQALEGIQGLDLSDYIPNSAHVRKASVAVVAVGAGEDQQSPFRFQSVNSYLNQMPVSMASGADPSLFGLGEEPDAESDPVGYMKYHLYDYLLMADGTVASQLRILDPDSMSEKPIKLTHGPDEGHAVTEAATSWEIPYRVKNTGIRGNMDFIDLYWGSVENVLSAAEQAQQELQAMNRPAGTPVRVTADASGIDWEALEVTEPSATVPDIPYQVNGTTEYVKFVAANLLAGNRYLDITKYDSQTGAPEFYDVLWEACSQNPLILMIAAPNYHISEKDGHTYVSVYDPLNSQNNDLEITKTLREQVNAKAEEIVASVITEQMTDAEKTDALNDYLANAVSYDWDYYNTHFSAATGAFIDTEDTRNPFTAQDLLSSGDGRMICSGYTAAFKLLADKAGLECVAMSRHVASRPGQGNNGHAWNLVKIDGSWRVVDVTWNDRDNGTQAQSDDSYLLLDQKDEKLSDRTYDADTVLDSVLREYVDPELIAG
ncbi:MAG: hypothetical protein Q4C65_01530 [Eubacteriales bacterium]|nr:hypothetical protein [Eubacteriales bacterium]